MSDYFNSKKFKGSIDRITKAFNFKINDFSQVPIVLQTNHYWLMGHDPNVIPEDYFNNPKSMLDFQLKGIEEHLEKVEDDYIPYLMPWYGVTVIPGAFGSDIIFTKNQDPATKDFGIKNLKDINNIRMPGLENNPFTKKVLDTINYFKSNSNYPVGITDMQSPLDCISLIIGYKNLFYWMKDNPAEIDYLFEIVTNTLIEWVKLQKKYIGEKIDCANGLINIKPPDGIGTWFSDDDAVILSPDLYEKFIINKYSKLFSSFGNGMMHWCGNANHQLDNLIRIKGLKAVHNFFLSDFNSVVKLHDRLKKEKICLVAGDIVPVDEELDDYLNSIKSKMDPNGLVLNFAISKKSGLKQGRYAETDRDIIETALRILDFFRG